jgi:hypothetical protein
VRRVPTSVALGYYDRVTTAERPFGELLEDLDAPLLRGEHEGCIMFTPEGFADAAAAFPRATTVSDEVKPSASERFAVVYARSARAERNPRRHLAQNPARRDNPEPVETRPRSYRCASSPNAPALSGGRRYSPKLDAADGDPGGGPAAARWSCFAGLLLRLEQDDREALTVGRL